MTRTPGKPDAASASPRSLATRSRRERVKKMERFGGTVFAGHKDAACEVPFDPAVRWGIPAGPLRKGRRGHRVRGRIQGVSFESAVVPRAGRFWLLIPEEILKSAALAIGESVAVGLERPSGPPIGRPARRKRRRN